MKASSPIFLIASQYCQVLSGYLLVFFLSTCQFDLIAQHIPVCYGLNDAYLCPEEPVTPDPALLSFFSNLNVSNPCFGLLEFDNFPGLTKCNGTDIPQNALFIHQVVFPVTSGSIGFASLQFRAKASPSGQTNTDFISFFEGSTYLTGANLNQLVEAAGTWNHNQDASFTLDLGNLPAVFSLTSILQHLSDGDIDVVIGNETGVDWMCLDAISDTCYCKEPSFTDLILHWDNGPGLSIQCQTSYESIPCPQPGSGYSIAGKFACEGDSCEMNPYVSWYLLDPLGNYHYGSSIASPYFVINLLPSQISQNGIYTMALTSFCGTDTCTCEFQFVVECDTLCPCDEHIKRALKLAVNQGFATIASTTGCTVCFAPVALSDCETVNWYLNDPNGTHLGSSIGNQTFCHPFSSPGTYTVAMEVIRFNPDGTICDSLVKLQTIRVTCVVNPVCDVSVFRNSSFSDMAIPGGFNSGGASEGWISVLKELEVVEGEAGSLDGWTIQLHGNLDTYGMLTTMNPVCLARDTGSINLRIRRGIIVHNGFIFMRLFQGDNPDDSDCDSSSCYEVARIVLDELEPGAWYDISIPYDLSAWHPADSCGNGVLVRPAIFVSNSIHTTQGDEDTYSYAHIDNFCMDGMPVAVSDPIQSSGIRIFPNPTTGELNIEMPFDAKSGISLQAISLTGQLLIEKKAEPGIAIQTMDASTLPQGMYFIQILSKGQVIAVNKFVKQ